MTRRPDIHHTIARTGLWSYVAVLAAIAWLLLR
jgi:hypothetical protein